MPAAQTEFKGATDWANQITAFDTHTNCSTPGCYNSIFTDWKRHSSRCYIHAYGYSDSPGPRGEKEAQAASRFFFAPVDQQIGDLLVLPVTAWHCHQTRSR